MAVINENLFVGFGGSGGKTLAKFAELTTSDKSLSEEMVKKVSFLLCDTDEKELNAAMTAIKRAFDNSELTPHVDGIQLATGVKDITTHIDSKYSKLSPEGKERFSEVWWVDSIKNPFVADNIDENPKYGASQCPAIASFLAWDKGKKIEETIDRVVEELKHRLPVGGDSQDVGVTFVSSLAGGTGRGCWQLLGFMIRESFAKHGLKAIPTAFFYDKSVFEKIALPEDKLRQSVNSLTGFSEAIMWARNAHVGSSSNQKIDYFLPHLERPESKEHDIIDCKNPTYSKKGISPVTSVWGIFNKSVSVAGLIDPDMYYDMTAGCLYAELLLTSKKSNRIGKFGSIGSAVWDVPIKGIRKLLKKKLMHQVCTDLLSGSGSSPSNSPEGLEVFEFSNIKYFDVDLKDSNSILAKIQHALASPTSNLDKALKDSNAKNAYKQAKSLDSISNNNIAEICVESLGGTFAKSGIRDTQSEVNKALIAKVNSTINSKMDALGNDAGASARLDISQTIVAKLHVSKQALDEISRSKKDPAAPIHAEVKKWSGFEYFSMKPWKRWGTKEINTILGMVPSARKLIAWRRVAEMLSAACSEAIATIGDTSSGHDAVEKLNGLAKNYEASISAQEKDFFTKQIDAENGKWDLKTGQLFQGDRFVQRRLKPAFTDEDWRDVLSGMQGQNYKDTLAKVKKILNEFMSNHAADEESVLLFEVQLSRSLDQLEGSLILDEEELQGHFNFTKVLKTILIAWQQHLKGMGQSDSRDALKAQFEEDFGLELIEKDGYLHLPADPKNPMDLLISMELILSKSCDAFFVLENNDHRIGGDNVYLFCPSDDTHTTEDGKLKKDILTKLKAKSGLADARLTEQFSPLPGITPYMLVAVSHVSVTRVQTDDNIEVEYATLHNDEPFDNIVSLRYWKQPVLTHWLEDAERDDGKSFFEGDGGQIYGLGYTDPRSVKDPLYKARRWNPWLIEDVSAIERRKNECLDAELYSLLGNYSTEIKAELKESCVADLKHLLQKQEIWTMPLVKKSGSSNFKFTRKVIGESSMEDGYSFNTDSFGGDNKKIGSIRKLELEFMENLDLREAVLEEFNLFTSGIVSGGVIRKEVFKDLVKALHGYLAELKENPGGAAGNRLKFVDHIGELISRIESGWSKL